MTDKSKDCLEGNKSIIPSIQRKNGLGHFTGQDTFIGTKMNASIVSPLEAEKHRNGLWCNAGQCFKPISCDREDKNKASNYKKVKTSVAMSTGNFTNPKSTMNLEEVVVESIRKTEAQKLKADNSCVKLKHGWKEMVGVVTQENNHMCSGAKDSMQIPSVCKSSNEKTGASFIDDEIEEDEDEINWRDVIKRFGSNGTAFLKEKGEGQPFCNDNYYSARFFAPIPIKSAPFLKKKKFAYGQHKGKTFEYVLQTDDPDFHTRAANICVKQMQAGRAELELYFDFCLSRVFDESIIKYRHVTRERLGSKNYPVFFDSVHYPYNTLYAESIGNEAESGHSVSLPRPRHWTNPQMEESTFPDDDSTNVSSKKAAYPELEIVYGREKVKRLKHGHTSSSNQKADEKKMCFLDQGTKDMIHFMETPDMWECPVVAPLWFLTLKRLNKKLLNHVEVLCGSNHMNSTGDDDVLKWLYFRLLESAKNSDAFAYSMFYKIIMKYVSVCHNEWLEKESVEHVEK